MIVLNVILLASHGDVSMSSEKDSVDMYSDSRGEYPLLRKFTLHVQTFLSVPIRSGEYGIGLARL